MKLGFIGHGRHAKNNLYPSLKFLGVQLQAIATTSEDTSQKAMRQQNSIRAYSSYKEMLEKENLDGVLISVSGDLHPTVVTDCLKSGVNVFVEKPLSLTLKDSQEIHDLSLKTGKFVMVGYMKRYAPVYQKIKLLIPEIGELTSINSTFGCRNFTDKPEEFLLQAAIHYVNLTQSFCGELIKMNTIVKAKGKTFSILSIAECEKDLALSMNLIASDSWSKLNEEIIITGTNGFIKYNNNESLVFHKNEYEKSKLARWQLLDEVDTVIKTVSTTSSGGNQDLYQRGFIPELEHFIECIAKDRSPLTDTLDNLKTMQWIDSILKS